MAIRITRIDDIDGSDGAEAIAFEIDHKTYEIDLCARNRIRFLRTIEPFIARARLVKESEEKSTITTIVRQVPSDASEDRPVGNSVTEPESGGLDLIEMARQVEG
jgi:hypothetical protein